MRSHRNRWYIFANFYAVNALDNAINFFGMIKQSRSKRFHCGCLLVYAWTTLTPEPFCYSVFSKMLTTTKQYLWHYRNHDCLHRLIICLRLLFIFVWYNLFLFWFELRAYACIIIIQFTKSSSRFRFLPFRLPKSTADSQWATQIVNWSEISGRICGVVTMPSSTVFEFLVDLTEAKNTSMSSSSCCYTWSHYCSTAFMYNIIWGQC